MWKHLPDTVLFALLCGSVALTFALKYFVDADAVKKEDPPGMFGAVWIPRRLLTTTGRKVRLVRDSTIFIAILVTIFIEVTSRR